LIIQAGSFDLRNTMIFACINQITAIDGVLCIFMKIEKFTKEIVELDKL
jgi:hypothetical protein